MGLSIQLYGFKLMIQSYFFPQQPQYLCPKLNLNPQFVQN
jgi:hypothetical protein